MWVMMWSDWSSHSLLVGMQNGATTLEDSLAVSYKMKRSLTSYNPVILLRSIYPDELKTYVLGHLCGSVVEHLPSAQVVILDSWDPVPYRAPCREPASPSACASASLSLSLSLCISRE